MGKNSRDQEVLDPKQVLKSINDALFIAFFCLLLPCRGRVSTSAPFTLATSIVRVEISTESETVDGRWLRCSLTSRFFL